MTNHFVFWNLITCAVTGWWRPREKSVFITAKTLFDIMDLKRYIPRKVSYRVRLSNILQSIHIPDAMLVKITEYLKSSYKTEKEQQKKFAITQELTKWRGEEVTIQKIQKRGREMVKDVLNLLKWQD